MKTKSILTTVLFLLSLFSLSGNKDSVYCLNIKGEFENAFAYNNRPCMIEIMSDDGERDTVYLYKLAKKLKCSLKRDREYCIKVSKAGFAPLYLCIDTRIDKADGKLYWFIFTTSLVTEKRARTFNKEKLQMPVTIVRFDSRKKAFAHDEAYTSTLKCDLVMQNRKW